LEVRDREVPKPAYLLGYFSVCPRKPMQEVWHKFLDKRVVVNYRAAVLIAVLGQTPYSTLAGLTSQAANQRYLQLKINKVDHCV
jgi:hypothetical protein